MPRTLVLARLAALVILAAGSAAQAQRAALVQDADAEIRAPYQEAAYGSCSFAGVCAMTFSAVPAGRRREVSYASCYLYTSNVASSVEYVELSSQVTLPTSRVFLPVVAYPGTSWSYNATAKTQAYYEPGVVPRIQAYTSARMVLFTCTLSGREVAI